MKEGTDIFLMLVLPWGIWEQGIKFCNVTLALPATLPRGDFSLIRLQQISLLMTLLKFSIMNQKEPSHALKNQGALVSALERVGQE